MLKIKKRRRPRSELNRCKRFCRPLLEPLSHEVVNARSYYHDLPSQTRYVRIQDMLEAFPGQGTKSYPSSTTPELDLLDETLGNHEALLRLNPGIGKSRLLYGNSYGLFAAAVVAGVITYKAAGELATIRKQLVQKGEEERGKTGMLSLLGPQTEQLEALLSSLGHGIDLQITNYNGPAANVVSGSYEALGHFKEEVAKKIGRARMTMLDIEGAYHHALRQTDALLYADALKHFVFDDPQIPLLSSTRPRILSTGEEVKREFWQQMFHPVQLAQVLGTAVSQGVQTVIETGPGASIKKLAARIPNHGLRLLSLEEDEEKIKELAI